MAEIHLLAQQTWLIWLIVVFALIVWWAFRAKNKRRFEADARMIFDDTPPPHDRSKDR